MAYSVDFPGTNLTLGVLKEAEHNVVPIRVFTNGISCISCWELSDEELEEIMRTKRVYISIMSGTTQYPVFIGSEKTTREVNADYGLWKE